MQDLNDEQAAAVAAPVGPVLVRAGAGSGKTRVLTLRIAHLIDHHRTPPGSILAVTFTNKAADELRQRLRGLLSSRARGITAGTFHSVGLRILRESVQGNLRPYLSSFSVYGQDEQMQVAATALDSFTGRPPVLLEPAELLARISRLKSRLLTPAVASRTADNPESVYVAALYKAYQRQLERHNAIDFDDCILLPLRLFAEHPEVLDRYSDRWRHVLVDEYQDTDRAQHALVEALTRREDGAPRSLFVVGDAQQAIYGFRNADHTIIGQFHKDFPGATVVDLRVNYRSRQAILDAAYAVIRHATTVQPLELRSHGRPITGESAVGIQSMPDARAEADGIAAHVGRLMLSGRRPSEIAVLFRTGFMSRQLEQSMRHARVPYRVRGADSFYDRAVVRDALAYVRAVANLADSLSLTRIVNKPTRGIGGSTLNHVAAAGAQLGLPLGEAVLDPRCRQGLKPQAASALARFASLLHRWRSRVDTTYPPANLLADIVAESGYRRYVEQTQRDDGEADAGDAPEWSGSRQQSLWDDEAPVAVRAPKAAPRQTKQSRRDDLELLDELVRMADEHTSLGDFLAEISLLTALPEKEDERNAVQLLTIHTAKGLEWPIVFVAGLEEGTLPHERCLGDVAGIEEERRLCYVAMTRAKEHLFLSWAGTRQKGKRNQRSRFLDDVERYGKERMRR